MPREGQGTLLAPWPTTEPLGMSGVGKWAHGGSEFLSEIARYNDH